LTNGDFEDSIPDKGIRPNRVEKFFFGNELAGPPDKLVKHREGFGSELDYLRASPQALISSVQAEGVENYAILIAHSRSQEVTESWPQAYDLKDACTLFSTLIGWMAIEHGLWWSNRS
jgi:hypothetical protein